MRPTHAEIDLGAIRHNVAVLRALVAPAEVLVVVKADAYGHGALPVAQAAVAAGASMLGVALVEEGVELRAAGIDAPVLVLSEPHPSSMAALVDASLATVAYTAPGVAALGKAAGAAGATVDVHLKVDTGMRRVGAEPADAVALARAVVDEPALRLAAAMTHLAVADEVDRTETAGQLACFDEVLAELRQAGFEPPQRHAANSAGAIAHPAARLDVVRCGIAVYGIAPGPELEGALDLRPAMRLVSEVSFVKQVPAGEGVSYGLAYTTPAATTLATVPVGYADGVPRPLGTAGGHVLIGGRRLPIAGNVTMDQLVVDCGPGAAVEPGAEVVLLGAQGGERVGAEEWAGLLGTIGYEIVTRAGPRVPRTYVDS